ncbi:MAG TPA: hypothetical protein VH796_13260 [Nitrososphaeraceae archaeon]|jgi:hypothetical protein
MKNNAGGFFITFYILTIFISLLSSTIVIGNPVLVFSEESSSNLPSVHATTNNTNNTGNNDTNSNSLPKQSATLSQNCKNSKNESACQDQHQLLVNSQSVQPQHQQEQSKPDNSCLFHPEQMKCKPDPITGKCPKGFSMNVYEHCFPKMHCPEGFENHNEDETGTCYPVLNPNSTHTQVSK